MTGRLAPSVLLEDERGRGFASVVECGPYLFMSAADGHRDLATEKVVASSASHPENQVRNSYQRIRQRLDLSGRGDARIVRLEHFVSSQDWIALRLALWREHFGIDLCTGGGSQAELEGINMVKTIPIGVVDPLNASVVAPRPVGPLEGTWAERRDWCARAYQPDIALEPIRPSKAVRAGDLIFLIGARGLADPDTGRAAAEECPEALPEQISNCFKEFASFLRQAGHGVDALLRVDVPLRTIARSEEFFTVAGGHLGGQTSVATRLIGVPVGGRGETDIQAMASATGEKEVIWDPDRPERALAVRANGLLFVAAPLRRRDGDSRVDALLDPRRQARAAIRNLAETLSRAGSDLGRVVRMDVALADYELEEDFLQECLPMFQGPAPALTFVQGRLRDFALVEVAAIAAA